MKKKGAFFGSRFFIVVNVLTLVSAHHWLTHVKINVRLPLLRPALGGKVNIKIIIQNS